MTKNDFDYVKINLASYDRIKEWTSRTLPNGCVVGNVCKPDTLNYRTLKPDVDGLFCEKIFGPVKSWHCYCGKYTASESIGVFFCEQCQVEITTSRSRRYRMGHIALAAPVTHVWYLKGIPSYLSTLLETKVFLLEQIIYFSSKLVFEDHHKYKIRGIRGTRYELVWDYVDGDISDYVEDSMIADLENLPNFDGTIEKIESFDYNTISNRPLVKVGTEAIKYYLEEVLNLENVLFQNRSLLIHYYNETKNVDRRLPYFRLNSDIEKKIRLIRLLENLIATECDPTRMTMDILPVIPPGLRPMVQLDGGRFATSDLNELYRRVIIRNNRLHRLLKLYAPAIIIINEKRMVQEAVDALIDNGKRGQKMLASNNRPLKSLSDIIAGKHGRFRQNLLGKRVDYSGRSVIIVGPALRLQQCGLPKEIAVDLFQPFIMHFLINEGLAANIKVARSLIQSCHPIIEVYLEELLLNHPILLNRAPTLHRLGIQAFQPIIVEGRAIKLHPLVCPAFNADFDGDQMAIHIPLSNEAIFEAYNLMLSPNNFISPASGEPIIVPSQDMVLGSYYLTSLTYCNKNSFTNHYFCNSNDVMLAYQQNKINLHTPIWVRTNQSNHTKLQQFSMKDGSKVNYYNTTTGRLILNNLIFKNLNIK